MLQELEVRKGVVHAVLNQALGKVMAVLSILSEMALRLLSKAYPTCWVERVACSRAPACSSNYEVKDEKTGTTLIAVQPLVADQTYMSQMKAMCVPFHMVYGRLMCY